MCLLSLIIESISVALIWSRTGSLYLVFSRRFTLYRQVINTYIGWYWYATLYIYLCANTAIKSELMYTVHTRSMRVDISRKSQCDRNLCWPFEFYAFVSFNTVGKLELFKSSTRIFRNREECNFFEPIECPSSSELSIRAFVGCTRTTP